MGPLPPATVALAALSALTNFTATEDGLLAADDDERKGKAFYRARYDLADALHRAYWTFMLERSTARDGRSPNTVRAKPFANPAIGKTTGPTSRESWPAIGSYGAAWAGCPTSLVTARGCHSFAPGSRTT